MLVLMENRTCSVEDCTSPKHVRGLCIKHYGRFMRHGSTDDPRPAGYGLKRDHPMYVRWAQLRSRSVLSPEWADFWRFVADVSPQPPNTKRMLRLDEAKPYGPRNYRWAEPLEGDRKIAYHRAYNDQNYPRLRAARIESTYGINAQEYERLYVAQGHGCAICKREASEPTRRGGKKHKFLAVDHCHDTGVVRGLLCTDCNVAIGLLQDSPALCEIAATYLTKGARKAAA